MHSLKISKYLNIVTVLTLILFSPFSMANESEDLEIPENILVYKSGYPEAPIIACPLPQKKYQDMLNQLDGIKQKIKSEACPSSQIAAIEKEVVSLEELITFGRNDFIELIKKGTSGEAQLSEKEVASLQKYVDQIVKKVASVTGLVNNPACFDEEEKVSTLSFLSSLVGDVSGAIGALAGPFGAKISIGGKLAASLLSSIDTIVQARKTYDYRKYEDRKNYLYNLCAYYEFKNDIDKETDVFTYSDRLYDLLDTSNVLLEDLARNCTDCRDVIVDYSSRVSGRGSFEVERKEEARFRSEILIGSADTPEVVLYPEQDFEIKTAANMTDSDLLDFYFDFTSEEVDADEPQQEPVVVDEGQTVGAEPVAIDFSNEKVLTVRALQVRSWVEGEIKDFQDNDSLGLTDDARREVMDVQKEIENFLFDREGVRYLDFYDDLLRSDFRRLTSVINQTASQLSFMHLQPDPNYKYEQWSYNIKDAIHDIFRRDVDFAEIVTQQMTQEDLNQILNQARRMVLENMGPVRLDYSILNERCLFFKNSLYQRSSRLEYTCEKLERRLNDTKKFFKDIQSTSFAIRYGSLVNFANNEDKNYTADWLASITSVFNQKISN